ncbi:hypothetical protein LP419_31735 [Massilia sp. H-1]|nr:hypothetical protein LP419_31735 [Massilia sp. H-1]
MIAQARGLLPAFKVPDSKLRRRLLFADCWSGELRSAPSLLVASVDDA